MTGLLADDAPAVMRATGIVRAFLAHDVAFANSIIAASLDEGPHELMSTLYCLAAVAGTAIKTLAAPDDDFERFLAGIQRQLMTGEADPT